MVGNRQQPTGESFQNGPKSEKTVHSCVLEGLERLESLEGLETLESLKGLRLLGGLRWIWQKRFPVLLGRCTCENSF